MVGTPLVIVKNRDGRLLLVLFSPLIFKGRPNRLYIARVERGESSTARSASTRDDWGLPVPIFLTAAGGPC